MARTQAARRTGPGTEIGAEGWTLLLTGEGLVMRVLAGVNGSMGFCVGRLSGADAASRAVGQQGGGLNSSMKLSMTAGWSAGLNGAMGPGRCRDEVSLWEGGLVSPWLQCWH